MSLLPVYKSSFFVSPHRPDGLRLKMTYANGLVSTDMSIGTGFEGYEDVVHGGMLFGVLDVIMWYAIFLESGKVCMTRKTDMDFLKPVMCDTSYRAAGRLLSIEERDVWAEGWIDDKSGERCAQVKALFREAKIIDYKRFMASFDFTGVSDPIKERFISLGRREP